jgi:hypothetical protein
MAEITELSWPSLSRTSSGEDTYNQLFTMPHHAAVVSPFAIGLPTTSSRCRSARDAPAERAGLLAHATRRHRMGGLPANGALSVVRLLLLTSDVRLPGLGDL